MRSKTVAAQDIMKSGEALFAGDTGEMHTRQGSLKQKNKSRAWPTRNPDTPGPGVRRHGTEKDKTTTENDPSNAVHWSEMDSIPTETTAIPQYLHGETDAAPSH